MNKPPSRAWSRKTRLLYVILSCGLLFNCAAPPPEDIFEARPVQRDRSQPANVRVYLDASGSMRGFTTAPAGTQYVQLLRDLRLALLSRWDQAQIRHFRFGPTVEQLPANFDFQPALSPAFYDQPTTAIQGPLNAVGPDSLMLAITDLCQDDGNVAAMIQSLRSRVLSSGLSVAIWGAKSEFTGRASCLWPPVPGFFYRTTGDVQTWRPFYILAIGGVDPILAFADELARVSSVVSRENLLVLTPQVLQTAMAWTPVKIQPNGAVVRTDIARESARGIPFGRFELRDTSHPTTIKAEFEIERTPNTPRIEFARVNPIEVSGKVWESQLLWHRSDARDWPEAAQAVHAEFKEISGSRLGLELTVDPGRMPASGVYAIELRPRAAGNAFELPKWCGAWSINSQTAGGCLGNPGSAACNKTLNLFEFTSSLWRVIVDHHKPQLGSLYVYVKR